MGYSRQTFKDSRTNLFTSVTDDVAAGLNGDWKHCEETWEALQGPCDSPDCQTEDGGWPECDCQGSEIVVIDCGYAEVWQDGGVVLGGSILFNVSNGEPETPWWVEVI